MSKKINYIEYVEAKFTINDIVNYLIVYKGASLPKLVKENEMSNEEKRFCDNFWLNRKRKNSEENINKGSSKNHKSKKNNKKENKNKDKDSSNSSFFSMSDIKNKKKNEKEKGKKLIKKECDKENYNENKINYYNNESKNASQNYRKNEIKNEEEGNKTKKYEREGYLLEDTPEEILNIGYKNKNDKTLYCLVKWKQQGKKRILDSIVENKKIREKFPQLLINFYERQIIFLDD